MFICEPWWVAKDPVINPEPSLQRNSDAVHAKCFEARTGSWHPEYFHQGASAAADASWYRGQRPLFLTRTDTWPLALLMLSCWDCVTSPFATRTTWPAKFSSAHRKLTASSAVASRLQQNVLSNLLHQLFLNSQAAAASLRRQLLRP